MEEEKRKNKKGGRRGAAEERNSLAGAEPVGVVEAAMNCDHEEEAIAQPPEREEEEGLEKDEVLCKLLLAEKAQRQVLAAAVFPQGTAMEGGVETLGCDLLLG